MSDHVQMVGPNGRLIGHDTFDTFDTKGLRVDLGEVTMGGSWSSDGTSYRFTVQAEPHFHYDPVTMTMPGHDPPVAWRAYPPAYCLDVIVCPALLLDGRVRLGSLPDEIPILDGEPGRLT